MLALTITAGYAAVEGHEGAGPARLDPKGLATPTVQRMEGPQAPDPGTGEDAPKAAPETRDAPTAAGTVRLAFAGGGT